MECCTRNIVLCSVLLNIFIICNSFRSDITLHLPENDSFKTVEVEISQMYYVANFKITCLTYDGLNHLNRTVLERVEWLEVIAMGLFFERCFDNETSHANYKNFKLGEFLNSNNVPESLEVAFKEFAMVDEKVFFDNFKFEQYMSIYLYKIGFDSTEFLSNLTDNQEIGIVNSGLIDFDQFATNKILNFESIWNNILNFNTHNLRKFTSLVNIYLNYNNFNNDEHVFNVPKLFEYNTKLTQIVIENSIPKLVLHGQVFANLTTVIQLSLASNKIEHIPENLFSDMYNIDTIILDHNLITNLEENTFLHNHKLLYLSLNENSLLRFSKSINILNFAAPQIQMTLEDINFCSVAELENILNHPHINRLEMSTFNMPQLSGADFSLINRSNQIHVTLSAGQTYFNFSIISATSLPKPISEYGTFLQIGVHRPSQMCQDCDFIKQIFHTVVDENRVYATDGTGNVLINFILSKGCEIPEMFEHFYRKFKENCPVPCECTYNEIIHKVRVNCNNLNLTEIPILLYPTQLSDVKSIDLFIRNNLLSTIDFTNQSSTIMEKVSSFDFEGNGIQSINVKDNHPQVLDYFNICENPIVHMDTEQIFINTHDGNELITPDTCLLGSQYQPDVKDIIKQRNGDRFNELLKTCVTIY